MTFMKTFWAALLAFVVANILLWMFIIMIFAGISAIINDPVPTIKKGTVLHLDLSNGIIDSPATSPFRSVGFGGIKFNRSNTILQALNAIERAAYDDNIKGIYINLKGGSVSLANIEEIRNALEEFKTSGKFIISYSDTYSQLGYYLASVADRVFLNPQGDIMWTGLASSVMFYKGLLDKLGIEPEILRHGTFKAAVEPFMYDKMSPENRLQLNTLLNTVWGSILHDVSVSRGIDSMVLSNYATELSLRSAKYAVEYGFADALLYEDQVMEVINRLSSGESIDNVVAHVIGKNFSDQNYIYNNPVGDYDTHSEGEIADMEIGEEDFLNNINVKEAVIMPFSDYIAAAQGLPRNISKNKVALLYADGDIIDGESTEGSVGGATLASKLAKVREDDDVKAVVLRVNSPGGSALASEVIWREMELITKEKPLIVSMGGLAASGGYYISCPADVILANRTTLTGSIGVFGLTADISKAMKDKLGITVDVAKTNPSADMGSLYRGLSSNEREVLQNGVEEVYSTFISHVADGRNISVDEVDNIGQGRVWSGVSAIDIGLVDSFGGLKAALELAVDRAGISDDFRLWQVVDEPESLTAIIRSLGNIKALNVKDELAETFIQYNTLKNLLKKQGIQARMPYFLDIQ